MALSQADRDQWSSQNIEKNRKNPAKKKKEDEDSVKGAKYVPPTPAPSKRSKTRATGKEVSDSKPKADPDYDPKTKTYSAEHNRKKYTRQREDAEKAADKGDKGAAETVRKIANKTGDKEKAMDAMNKAQVAKLPSWMQGAAKGAGTAIDTASKVGTDLYMGNAIGKGVSAGTKAVGGLAGRAAKGTADAFGRWAKGAGRSGTEAAEKTAARVADVPKPRTPQQAAQKAEDAKSTVGEKAGNAPKKPNTEGNDRTDHGNGTSSSSTPPKTPKVKKEKTPDDPKWAEHPGLKAWQDAPKGSEERKALWKGVPPEVARPYQASRAAGTSKATMSEGEAAKPSTSKPKGRPKADKAAAPESGPIDAHEQIFKNKDVARYNELSNEEKTKFNAKYTEKGPDGSMRFKKSPGSDAPAAEPAAPAADKPKGGFVKDKIKANTAKKKAAADAPTDAPKAQPASSVPGSVAEKAKADIKAKQQAKKDAKADISSDKDYLPD